MRKIITGVKLQLSKGPFYFSLTQFCSDEMSRTAIDIDIRLFASERQISSSDIPFGRILLFDLNIGKNAGFIKKVVFFNISPY